MPLLAKALGLPVKMALLKGRANYLCRHRLELATASSARLSSAIADRRGCSRACRDGPRPPRAATLSELTDLPEQSAAWPMITSTRENCLGQECPQFSRCHVFEARRQAQAAQIVVVNHHLLLADLALKDEGFGDLLPGADAVILDEAHQVPDIAAQFFGQTWSVRQAQILLRDASAEMSAAGVRAPAAAQAMADVEALLEELRAAFSERARDATTGRACRMRSSTHCRGSRRPSQSSQGSSRVWGRVRARPIARGARPPSRNRSVS